MWVPAWDLHLQLTFRTTLRPFRVIFGGGRKKNATKELYSGKLDLPGRRIMKVMPEILSYSDVGFLPIVAAFVKKIGVAEEVDRLCAMESDVRPGVAVSAMILDTLSGRSPLYRFDRFCAQLDTELLLGEQVDAAKFNDDALGRVLDRMSEVGTGLFLTAVCLKVHKLFKLDTSHAHHDTTSVTVYGNYDLYGDPNHKHPFVVTNGFNKDHRPDLKQIVHSLLCVDHGIPIRSKLDNGNKSDKTVNEDLLRDVVDRMRQFGAKNFLYVADSALVTPTNLELMNDEKKGCRFVTRLPETYAECIQAIERAVATDGWNDIGILSRQIPTKNRKPAFYRAFETTVTLYGRIYRALIVHSDAHDKRKTKKLDKAIKEDITELLKIKAAQEKINYQCLPDAQAAVARLPKGKFHGFVAQVNQEIRYGKGRPKGQRPRKIAATTYSLILEIHRDEAAIAHVRQKAGCFVLISNTLRDEPEAEDSRQLLSTYKDQGYVERNFGFLKDDAIVNSLFLKSPGRIEALGLILVLSLLVWRLMERTMRLSLKQTGSKILGWDKRQTSRPTSFMMTTYFMSVLVIQTPKGRMLGRPLNPIQSDYLAILQLPAAIFLDPSAGFIDECALSPPS
jgi:transposase